MQKKSPKRKQIEVGEWEEGGTGDASAATVGPAGDASASPADTASPKRKEREEWEWEGGADEKRRSPPVTPAQMDNSLAGEGVDSQYGSMTDADVLEGVPDINMVREEVPDINMV